MRSPRPPRPLFPPSDSDIALAEAGDKSAYERVKKQRTRMRKREREIAQWEEKNSAVAVMYVISPAVSDDDVSLHDDAADDNAFTDDIPDDVR
jgi:hypothetical protein